MADVKTVSAERLAKLEKFEEAQRKAAEHGKRVVAKDRLMVEKAKKAGITVTEKEIDDYLASRPKRG